MNRHPRDHNETELKTVRRRTIPAVPSPQRQFELIQNTLHKALKRGGKLAKLGPKHRRKLKDLSRSYAKKLMAMNPWAGDLWTRYLEQAYSELNLPNPYFVTVFDHEFEFLLSAAKYGNRSQFLA